MENEKDKRTTRQRLEDIQLLILENKKLQEQYPNQKKSLLITLRGLKGLEEEIFEEIKKEKLSQNTETYETILNSSEMKDNTIPSEKLGYFLIDNQHTIDLFANDPLAMNESIESNDLMNSRLDFFASASGSFKILFTSKQKILTDIDDAKTPIRVAFNKIEELASYKNDDKKLDEMTKKFGKKQINQYKKLVKTLYENNLDMEIKKISTKHSKSIFKLDSKDSKKIYDTLNKDQFKQKKELELVGVIKVIDLLNNQFKIVTKIDNRKKTIGIEFKSEFEEEIKNKLNERIRIKIKRITKLQTYDRNSKNEYFLLEILD